MQQWKSSVTQENRKEVINKFVQLVHSASPQQAMADDSKLLSLAMNMEQMLFDKATSKDNYIQLIKQRISVMQAKLKQSQNGDSGVGGQRNGGNTATQHFQQPIQQRPMIPQQQQQQLFSQQQSRSPFSNQPSGMHSSMINTPQAMGQGLNAYSQVLPNAPSAESSYQQPFQQSLPSTPQTNVNNSLSNLTPAQIQFLQANAKNNPKFQEVLFKLQQVQKNQLSSQQHQLSNRINSLQQAQQQQQQALNQTMGRAGQISSSNQISNRNQSASSPGVFPGMLNTLQNKQLAQNSTNDTYQANKQAIAQTQLQLQQQQAITALQQQQLKQKHFSQNPANLRLQQTSNPASPSTASPKLSPTSVKLQPLVLTDAQKKEAVAKLKGLYPSYQKMDYIISLFKKAKPPQDYASKISKLVGIQKMLKEQYKELPKNVYYLLPDIIDIIQTNINKFWEYGEALHKPSGPSLQPITSQTDENSSLLTTSNSLPGAAIPRINTAVPKATAPLLTPPSTKKKNIADSFHFAMEQDRIFRGSVKEDAMSIIRGSWMQSDPWLKELDIYRGLFDEPDDDGMEATFDDWAAQDDMNVLFPGETWTSVLPAESNDESALKPLNGFQSLKEEFEVLATTGIEVENVQKESNLWTIHDPQQNWRLLVKFRDMQIDQLQWLQPPPSLPSITLPCSLSRIVELLNQTQS